MQTHSDYQFVFDRMMAQKSKWPPSAVLRTAVDVARNATSALDHSELGGLLKNFISKKEYFLSPDSLEACNLYSHLGNDLRVRNELEAAENLCAPDSIAIINIVIQITPVLSGL